MVDHNTVEKINKLEHEYLKTNNAHIIDKIEALFQELTYQIWDTKANIQFIENPNGLYDFKESDEYKNKFGSKNAFSKYHLVVPLLLYLFINHNKEQSALETSLSFMSVSKDFLKHGDFAKTKTGAQRFVTNTRFASQILRDFGFLRSDKDHFYKYWSLSPFGILLAGQLYFDLRDSYSLNFFNQLSWQSSNVESRKIILEFLDRILSRKSIEPILKEIMEEEVIVEHLNLTRQKFIQFVNIIRGVLNEGYKPNNQNTQQLISYINSINSDKELSSFADSIILKKEININIADAYRILGLD
jgi:hypothetical protein